jgi:hypothetical protein
MLTGHQVAIANVGANTKHYEKYGKIRSPLLERRKFELVPIPTGELVGKDEVYFDTINDWPKYKDLTSFYDKNENLSKYLPAHTRDKWLDQPVHNDPQFRPACDHNMYGDWYDPDSPKTNPRPTNLWRLDKGDYIFFLAHLWPWTTDGGFEEPGGFYIIGFLEIEKVIHFDHPEKELKDLLEPYRENPHALAWFKLHRDRKACADLDFKNNRIFLGNISSKRFPKAIPFDWNIAVQVLRDSNDNILELKGKSPIARIGSYTRTVRLLKGFRAEERKKILWKYAEENAFQHSAR